MLSKRKRELFRQLGRSAAAEEADEPAMAPANSNEDSGLSARSAESPPSPGASQSHVLPSAAVSPKPPTATLMNAEHWAQLNEQIRQICLDCSNQFGSSDDRPATEAATLSRRNPVMRGGERGKAAALMGTAEEAVPIKQSATTGPPITMPNSTPKSMPTPMPSPRTATLPLPPIQPAEAPPTKSSSNSFSLPRLFLPRASPKEKQQKRPKDADEHRQLQEQHSPTTTTSAYGTGGTDTGQESPVERQQQQRQPQQQQQHLLIAGAGAGHQKPMADWAGKQANGTGSGGSGRRPAPAPKSVKFDLQSASNQFLNEVSSLPAGLFYTSAERLAETLEIQQRLLREELFQQQRGRGGGAATLQQQQKHQPSLSLEEKNAKRPLIRVPLSPLRTSPARMANSGTTTPPISPQQIVHPKVPPTLPKPISRQLPPPPPASVQKLVSMREKQQQPKPSNIAAMTAAAANAERCRQLKPVDLDNIFAYKPSKTGNSNERNFAQQKQNQAVLEVNTQQRNQQCQQQPQQQAQQPQQQLQLQLQQPQQQAQQTQQHAQPSQQELEWVVKRRPDGTRYVTRRPVRQQQRPCWSSVVKARREQSLLRERHQSGAASTTTDDDGATGSEFAVASRLWMRDQRRRHKGRGADASVGGSGGRRQQQQQQQQQLMWTGSEQQQQNSDFGGQQQRQLLRSQQLKGQSRLEQVQQIPGMPAGYGKQQQPAAAKHPQLQQPSRGNSLPGQALFSVTTV